MDFLTLAIKDSAFLHLTHPATREPMYFEDAKGKKKPVGMLLGSQTCPQWRAAYDDAERAGQQYRKKGTQAPKHEIESRTVAMLQAITFGVQGINVGGTEVTPENVGELVYSNHSLRWIRRQVEMFNAEDANFLEGAEQS